MKLGK
jgi:hypothetical protein